MSEDFTTTPMPHEPTRDSADFRHSPNRPAEKHGTTHHPWRHKPKNSGVGGIAAAFAAHGKGLANSSVVAAVPPVPAKRPIHAPPIFPPSWPETSVIYNGRSTPLDEISRASRGLRFYGHEIGDSEASDSEDALNVGDSETSIPGLVVASSERDAVFHELFPNVPQNDHLIEDYECSLRGEQPVHGRLYVSEKHICFYPNALGSAIGPTISFSRITSLRKNMTTPIAPSAIQICISSDKHIFESFLSRDSAYDEIYNIWRLAHPHSEVESSADFELAPVSAAICANAHRRASTVHPPTLCSCGEEGEHFDTVVMDTILPSTPNEIHELMFGCEFAREFMAREQNFVEIQISDWSPQLTRSVTYTKLLSGGVGAKQTKCELEDETIHLDFDNYISIVTTIRTPDVPSGSAFLVKVRTCIMWAGTNSSRLVVSATVEWTGRSFIQSIVEKTSIDGQKQYYARLETAMRSYIAANGTDLAPIDERGDETESVEVKATPSEDDSTPRIEGVELNSPSKTVSAQDMFKRLVKHGCTDLTSDVNNKTFSSEMVTGGSFGDIWRGKLHDGTDVAIKVWRFAAINEDGRKSIKRAMRELYNWSKADHENVHKLLGVVMFQGRLGMVSTWMEAGNLREYIDKNPDVDRHQLCIQVAEGLAYLHSINIVHGDLKACNVLVSSEGTPKLTDFDHSIITDCSLRFTETSRIGGGTLRWMAPELVLDTSFDRSKQADVYALGMTILEIITGTIPYYPQCQTDAQVVVKLMQKSPPVRTKHFNQDEKGDQTWALLLQCWDHNPNVRPTAQRVLDSLQDKHDEWMDTVQVNDHKVTNYPVSAVVLLSLLVLLSSIGLRN